MSVQNNVLSLSHIAHEIAEAITSAKNESELAQVALSALHVPLNLFSSLLARKVSSVSKMKFSQIYEGLGLNIFLLSGQRKLLVQKFEEEFGHMTPSSLLEEIAFPRLKQLNDFGIVSDEKFSEIRQSFIENARSKLDELGFSKFFFEFVPQFKLEQISQEQLILGEIPTFETIFSPQELQEIFLKQYPDEKAIFENFTPKQIAILFIEEVLNQELFEKIQSQIKEKFLSLAKPMFLSQLLNQPPFSEEEGIPLLVDSKTRKLNQMHILTALFTEEELQSKFQAEFTGWDPKDIIGEVPGLEAPQLQFLFSQTSL